MYGVGRVSNHIPDTWALHFWAINHRQESLLRKDLTFFCHLFYYATIFFFGCVVLYLPYEKSS